MAAKKHPAPVKGKNPVSKGRGIKTVKAAKAAPAAAKAPPRGKAKAKDAPSAKDTRKAAAPQKPVAAPPKAAPAPKAVQGKNKGKGDAAVPAAPQAPRMMPRATKLPPMGEPFTQREVEQLLTAGLGRGVVGEGSLKGRLVVKDNLPHLVVLGRDKRELDFLLEGPDQEVLPAYVDHKVSVSGLIRKTTNHGGVVAVRKYAAKKPETEGAVEAAPAEQKLRYLSPGEVEQLTLPGMAAGVKGFGQFRGHLEMTGEQFFLVASGGGTRQQVSFILEGKNARGLKKHLGHTVLVTGVVEKSTGWGGTIQVESCEARGSDFRSVSRDALDVAEVENISNHGASVEVKQNHGLSVRLQERANHTWAIEPTTAKRLGLREANFEPSGTGHSREFFFTPRNPGEYTVEFFLAKALAPAQVARTVTLNVLVKA
ncbi:MAG: hypothetical protein RL653_3893 [Pseudomonadota bacterium]|jgi:hypothetical protein